ncbi:hypothetical protein [Aphanothece sacrum]|uniref:Uncharacterized protein n=1 Tax=Aphanothece sacrum FPU1 TaxID=1920663 RepID=A0A401IGA8_APHSA|nr:hypothetical protein [Aphanothece sacrum]GBF80308.1 hypothetical protein AsFPU1_1709 [Aphanothece sacrum FPU1]GBF83714.1 hypothetical protein AsFPU3_0757 [Aphanothece sacrum FPU3]
MLSEFLPFQISLDKVMIAGACLWALAFYLGFSSLRECIIEGLNRWFNFAERSLYISVKEFERTRKARESQNAFYASIFSIIPFLAIGGICNWVVELGLGKSWAVSIGILTCMACGIYELGRRST